MAKVTAIIMQDFEGSDDPRAIEGGGGAGSKIVKRCTCSAWLVNTWIKIASLKYDEHYYVAH